MGGALSARRKARTTYKGTMDPQVGDEVAVLLKGVITKGQVVQRLGTTIRVEHAKGKNWVDLDAVKEILKGGFSGISSVAENAAVPSEAEQAVNTIITLPEDVSVKPTAMPDMGALAERFRARPKRSGMYFVVHNSLLSEIEYVEVVDVNSEFLSLHPNYDARAAGFVMARLDSRHVASQRSLLRMSSYRWANVCGVGVDGNEYMIPSNYGWFMDHIKANRLIGTHVHNAGLRPAATAY